MHNKIFISVDFEAKKFDRKLAENQNNRPKSKIYYAKGLSGTNFMK